MRFGNKKTVHLTIFEMKEPLMDYFIKRGFEELAEHLNNNSWNLDLLVRQKYWLLSMEGETSVEDE